MPAVAAAVAVADRQVPQCVSGGALDHVLVGAWMCLPDGRFSTTNYASPACLHVPRTSDSARNCETREHCGRCPARRPGRSGGPAACRAAGQSCLVSCPVPRTSPRPCAVGRPGQCTHPHADRVAEGPECGRVGPLDAAATAELDDRRERWGGRAGREGLASAGADGTGTPRALSVMPCRTCWPLPGRAGRIDSSTTPPLPCALGVIGRHPALATLPPSFALTRGYGGGRHPGPGGGGPGCPRQGCGPAGSCPTRPGRGQGCRLR